jgi:hypothetical protein
MNLNMDNIDEKRVYNLTQLRKNNRERSNKKAGQKPPRPCDEDQLSVINPAPDSVKKYSFISSTPILTPQSILKKRKATSPVHVTAKKKIRFEDNSSDNVIIVWKLSLKYTLTIVHGFTTQFPIKFYVSFLLES